MTTRTDQDQDQLVGTSLLCLHEICYYLEIYYSLVLVIPLPNLPLVTVITHQLSLEFQG